MAEEDKQRSEAQPEDAPVEEQPEDAPAEDADIEAEAADEPAAEESPSEAEAPADEPEQPLGPKAKRKLERSRAPDEAGPPRTADQRAEERAERRRAQAAMRRRRRPRERERRRGGEPTPAAEREPGSRKVRLGTVVSDKADKTITVRIEVVRRHPVYEKVVRRSATVHAHDERNEANEGDTVRVIESRPLSRSKRWRLVEILEKAR